MDEQTIKVLARFTEVGEKWPWGAWYYYYSPNEICRAWQKVEHDFLQKRLGYEICELEANQKGIYRKVQE